MINEILPPVVAIVLLALMAFLFSVTGGRSHDWYPPDCCSGHDCFPIAESDLIPIPEGGFRVRGTEWVVSDIRPSQDGQWHLCSSDGTLIGKPKCVFEPTRGF